MKRRYKVKEENLKKIIMYFKKVNKTVDKNIKK